MILKANVGASATAVSSIEVDGHLYLLAGGESKMLISLPG